MTSTSYPFGQVDCRVLGNLLEAGLAPQVVYDVGASNGSWTWTVAGLMKGATFHLFEPQLKSDKAFAQTMANVQKHVANVTLHPIALGAEKSRSRLHKYQDSSAASMFDLTPTGWYERLFQRHLVRPSTWVKVFPLDLYVEKRRLPQPDIIKMDVQGFELEVLKGADKALPGAKLVMIECWLERSYGPETPLLHEVIDYMTGKGFVLYDLGDTFHGERKRISAVDAYFLREDVAMSLFPQASDQPNWRQ